MSKKMKGVSLDPSPYGVYEDARARFKHQTLMQEYKELHKETEAMRNKLEITKQRKLTLLAEVRFLRRRHRHLLKNKAGKPPQGRQMVQPQNYAVQPKGILKKKTDNRKKNNLQNLATVSDANQKDGIFSGKESTLRNLNPVLDLNQKNRIHRGKEATFRNTTPVFDLNQKEIPYSGKEAAYRNLTPILDLNQSQRLYSGKEIAHRNSFPAFDLNQMERSNGRENAVQSRAPIFDLNQISGEEEELQDNYETLRIEEPKKFVSRGGTDEQQNDLMLSACRTIGTGPNRAGKRKISWQDPVALKV